MISFVVPIRPQGKGRPRFARAGDGVRTYTDAKTRAYEEMVRLHAIRAMSGRKPFDAAVEVEILAGFKSSTTPGWFVSGADADNIGKAALDAMNGVVYRDDGLVVSLLVVKIRTWSDQLEITVSELP